MKKTWIEQYKTAAQYYGVDYETLIQEQTGMTVEEFEKQVDVAVKDVMKEKIVADAIAKKENIKLDEKTYASEVESIAKDNGYDSAESLKKAVKEDDLKDEALKNVVKSWIADKCIQIKAK